MRAINDINAPTGLDLNWRLQSLANMAKQKIGPLLGFSGVFQKPVKNVFFSIFVPEPTLKVAMLVRGLALKFAVLVQGPSQIFPSLS